MSFKYKDVYAAAAEVLGIVLAYMEEKEQVRAYLSHVPRPPSD